MNGQKGSATTTTKKPVVPNPVPSSSISSSSSVVDKENVALKSEVSQLKSKLDQMTKNIDELTSLVQKVSLQQAQQQQQTPLPPAPTVINANNKRTKVEDSLPPLPDIPQSSFSFSTTTMDVDDFSPPSIPSPMHPTLTTSETPSELSDDTFVDQLFTAFKTEHFDFEDTVSMATPKTSTTPHQQQQQQQQRASPELMAKLSDALATLPLQIQELIVNRLIQAIMAPKEIQEAVRDEAIVPLSPVEAKKTTTTPNLPLAAATLAALLAQYGEDAIKAAAKDASQQANNAKHQANTANSNRKALLIPVHA